MSAPIKYLKSCVLPVDYPEASRPEVAIVGRSNAGKSSLLNAMTGTKIAHVSNTPGKTRLLSFFDYGKHYRWVDMPGYGFASRSGAEMQQWQKMIETYLSTRTTLTGLILVMDVRRDIEEDEKLLFHFCHQVERPIVFALSKTDKLNNKELQARLKSLRQSFPVGLFFPISSLKRTGIKELEDYIFQNWIKNRE